MSDIFDFLTTDHLRTHTFSHKLGYRSSTLAPRVMAMVSSESPIIKDSKTGLGYALLPPEVPKKSTNVPALEAPQTVRSLTNLCLNSVAVYNAAALSPEHAPPSERDDRVSGACGVG